ncbi:MAG: hypothetical protein HUJ42_02390 [Malacoplasma sp.]|nr:hypothetical protein [Malacoplasma sp.]
MQDLKQYYQAALEFKPQYPIERETGDFICNFINENKIYKMLEIGSGVGYSANYFALNSNVFQIDSYEKDFGFYEFAKKNVLSKKINFYWKDFLYDEIQYNLYPLIFIDASKASQIKIFEKAINFLDKNGVIIVDNIDLKRVKEKYNHPWIHTKATKSIERLLTRNEEFKNFLASLADFEVVIYEVGDGVAICTSLK